MFRNDLKPGGKLHFVDVSSQTGIERNVYGMGASPILAGDLVVLVCDQNRGSFAAGFRQSDGREVWRTPRAEALHALQALGYKPPEAQRMLEKVATEDATTEDLIRAALQGTVLKQERA